MSEAASRQATPTRRCPEASGIGLISNAGARFEAPETLSAQGRFETESPRGSTAEEPMVCTTLRWREMDSNFESLSEIAPLAPGQMIGKHPLMPARSWNSSAPGAASYPPR
jgi:hypothetical protein